MPPLIEDIFLSNECLIELIKVDVDELPETTQNFGVASVPHLMLFKEGEKIDEFIGLDENQVKDFCNRALAQANRS